MFLSKQLDRSIIETNLRDVTFLEKDFYIRDKIYQRTPLYEILEIGENHF